MILDLSLGNESVYEGVDVREIAGRPTLLTEPEQASQVIGANLAKLPVDPDHVELTGAAPIWVYLIAFHHLHGRTRRILYRDGRGATVLVAAHG